MASTGEIDYVKQLTYTGELLYGYSQTGETFPYKSDLKNHQQARTEEKPHQCSQCDKTYSCDSDLLIHLKTHMPPYQCSQCDKAYSHISSFKVHLRSHTG
ncbi:unnamed protein product, partial [Meganyctiphanes norvegica]